MEHFDSLEVEEKNEEETGTCLFHHWMLQRRKMMGENANIVIQQLIVIARLPHSFAEKTRLGDYYEELVYNSKISCSCEAITGLLLIYPTCLLHVIEGSRETLNSVIKDMAQQPKSVLLDAKIVFMGHDLQSRLFKDWHYKVLKANQVSSKAAVEGDEEENTETLVCSVLSALQQLKKHLATGAFPGEVLDENPELIISQNILEKLMSRDDFMSPQQYLEIYNLPLNISVEIGKVDPRSLFPDI